MTFRELVRQRWEVVKDCNVIGRDCPTHIDARRRLLTARFDYDDAATWMRRAVDWKFAGDAGAVVRCVRRARYAVRKGRAHEAFVVGGGVPALYPTPE